MKHIIIGGDGLLGRRLAEQLTAMGENVVVADIVKGRRSQHDHIPFVQVDVTDAASFHHLPISANDIVYNFATRTPDTIVPRGKRRAFYWPVNYQGLKHILHWMEDVGARKLVHFSTDMVYGRPPNVPTLENEACEPLGEYGRSKVASERLCQKYRNRGFSISIFRPRPMIDPERPGMFSRICSLIDRNVPVPLMGSGRKPHQFVSADDCVSACIAAWKVGFPSKEYNLGSAGPVSLRALVREQIDKAGSYSVIVPMPVAPARLVLGALDIAGVPIMDPEQYLIAGNARALAIDAAKHDLDWTPQYRDNDILDSIYRKYRSRSYASACAISGEGQPLGAGQRR